MHARSNINQLIKLSIYLYIRTIYLYIHTFLLPRFLFKTEIGISGSMVLYRSIPLAHICMKAYIFSRNNPTISLNYTYTGHRPEMFHNITFLKLFIITFVVNNRKLPYRLLVIQIHKLYLKRAPLKAHNKYPCEYIK